MTLREIMDWVLIQGKVMISEIDTEDFEVLLYTDAFEWEYLDEEIENMYVKYMFTVDDCLKIELSKEKY